MSTGPEKHSIDELEPMRINTRALFLIGTAAWAGGLIVYAVIALTTELDVSKALWVCAVGIAIGLAGIWDARRRARPGYLGNK